MIVQSVSIPKPVLYAGATGGASSIPIKGKANFRYLKSDNVCEGVDLSIPMKVVQTTMNTSLFKEEFTRIPVWVKIHEVPLQVFDEDEISLIPSQNGNPIMLDSFTSSMCSNSWGRSIFARCLIKVKAKEVLKESITIGIPMPKDIGHVYDQYPKNAIATPTIDSTNDGFQTHIKPKVIFEPKAHRNSSNNRVPNVSSPANDGPFRNGVPKVSTSAKVDLYKEWEDVDSKEEVEVVYDESANLLKSTKTVASTSTASDFQNT
ncbi:zinc knuckle CX2CX4HX4C containing protein [Tanacetum coccineum]